MMHSLHAEQESYTVTEPGAEVLAEAAFAFRRLRTSMSATDSISVA